MDFQYTYSIYPQEGFYQEQGIFRSKIVSFILSNTMFVNGRQGIHVFFPHYLGVQHVLTNQAEDTYFHGVGKSCLHFFNK